MSKGFLHVNGVTYELAYPQNAVSIDGIRTSLTPSPVLAGSVRTFEVLVDGVQVSLAVDLERMWSHAAWTVEATEPVVPHIF